MSSILDYIKKLLPVTDRKDILSIVEQLRDEHNETIMPVVQELSELLSNRKFKSKLYITYDQRLRTHVNVKGTAFEALIQSLERLQSLFPFLEKEIREQFGPQVAADSLTYDEVNVLRYLESVGFYIRYARKFLLKVLADEASAIGGTQPNWVRAEVNYLETNLNNFAGLFTAIHVTESELKAILRKVSSATVDPETSNLAFRSLGQNKIDPMRLNAFSPQRNFILAIGKALAEWQHNRYRAAKEDLAALQLRLQELRELEASGKSSPKLQKAITNLEERVEKLDAKIAKIEEEANEEREEF